MSPLARPKLPAVADTLETAPRHPVATVEVPRPDQQQLQAQIAVLQQCLEVVTALKTLRVAAQRSCYAEQPAHRQDQTLGKHETSNEAMVTKSRAWLNVRRLKKFCKVFFLAVTFYLFFAGRPQYIAIGIWEATYQAIVFGPTSECRDWLRCNAP